MKQIYQFERVNPPYLNEKILRAEKLRREMRKQMLLLALGGVLFELCLLVGAIVLYPVSPVFTFSCMVYLCISMSGGGAVAMVFINKRRQLEWRSH